MSLTQISDRVHVYRGGVNFCILLAPERQLILVDTGLDSGNARKALRPFFEQGFVLRAIINTHSHADHIGGNADLVRRTGCEVYAPARERPYILWPELEPMGLYGAWPPPSLLVKLLRAEPTPQVIELPEAPCLAEVAGLKLELIPVPGHAFGQVAIALDDVLIMADGLFKPEVIEKHPVIFLVNVAEYLSSLDRLGARPERVLIPGHGDVIDRSAGGADPLPLVLTANREAVRQVQESIMAALNEPREPDDLLAHVAQSLGKVYQSEAQYFLDRATIGAHLSDLLHREMIQGGIRDGRRILTR